MCIFKLHQIITKYHTMSDVSLLQIINILYMLKCKMKKKKTNKNPELFLLKTKALPYKAFRPAYGKTE